MNAADGPGGEPAVSRWRARTALLALFALFFVPIVGAFILNATAPGWLPFGRVNRGDLVQPAREAGLLDVVALSGERWATLVAREPWTLVHVSGPACTQLCVDALVSMRQARLALGKDADRVGRWWLVTAPADAPTVARVQALDPGLRIGLISSDAAVVDSAARGVVAVQVVDPSGYLVLRYREPRSASEILQDMKRLLKISKQG